MRELELIIRQRQRPAAGRSIQATIISPADDLAVLHAVMPLCVLRGESCAGQRREPRDLARPLYEFLHRARARVELSSQSKRGKDVHHQNTSADKRKDSASGRGDCLARRTCNSKRVHGPMGRRLSSLTHAPSARSSFWLWRARTPAATCPSRSGASPPRPPPRAVCLHVPGGQTPTTPTIHHRTDTADERSGGAQARWVASWLANPAGWLPRLLTLSDTTSLQGMECVAFITDGHAE